MINQTVTFYVFFENLVHMYTDMYIIFGRNYLNFKAAFMYMLNGLRTDFIFFDIVCVNLD